MPAKEVKVAPKEVKKASGGLSFKSILTSIVFVFIGLYAGAFLSSGGTMDFSYLQDYKFFAQLNQWRQQANALVVETVYGKSDERVFTPEELAQYDGTDPEKPILLAIKGKVYDVSKGKSYYGKGGSYGYFSGKDASRAYITGCFETHLTPDLRGLTEDELKSLESWVDFYENSSKYFYVGKVLNPPIDPSTPIPPPCK